MSLVVWLSGAIGAGIIAVAVAECVDLASRASARVVRRAARHLPTADARARYEEEWLAELAFYDGLKLVKLAKALSIWAGSWRLGRTLDKRVRLAGYLFTASLNVFGIWILMARLISGRTLVQEGFWSLPVETRAALVGMAFLTAQFGENVRPARCTHGPVFEVQTAGATRPAIAAARMLFPMGQLVELVFLLMQGMGIRKALRRSSTQRLKIRYVSDFTPQV